MILPLTLRVQVQELRTCVHQPTTSCCSEEYGEKIIDREDPISSILAVIPSDQSQCQADLGMLACAQCSAWQGDWAEVHSWGVYIYVCSSYCEELYESCNTELIRTASGSYSRVGEEFSNGDDFCHALAAASSNITFIPRSSSSTDCFDNSVGTWPRSPQHRSRPRPPRATAFF